MALFQLQLIAVFAASLGEVEIATHNTVLQFFIMLSAVMFAFVDSTSIRVAYVVHPSSPRSPLYCWARSPHSTTSLVATLVDVCALRRYHLGAGNVSGAQRTSRIMLGVSVFFGT